MSIARPHPKLQTIRIYNLRDLRALRGKKVVPVRAEPVDGASSEKLSFEIAPLRRQIIQ